MNKDSDNLLMIFVKNSVLGKVKSRIAKTVGNEAALHIYKMLLSYTEKIVCKTTGCDNAVFYSDYFEMEDVFSIPIYQKYLQNGNDLGERMKNAFALAFSKGYKKVVIIGSDCVEITEIILEDAFLKLNSSDVVIGPATDGGYYLLGMQSLHEELFKNIPWSTENVLLDTISILKKYQMKYHLLPVLSDVDTSDNINQLEKLKVK